MSSPGWYRDPSGQPGLRWWDGQSWSEHVRRGSDEAGSAGPTGTGPQRPRSRLIPAVIAGVVVLALIGFATVRFLGGQDSPVGPAAGSGTPTVSGWDETSSPSPTATASPTPATAPPLVACPAGDPALRAGHPADSRVHGGDLSFKPSSGWDDYTESRLAWSYDLAGVYKPLVPTWINWAQAGALRIGDGWESPQKSAEQMIQCMVGSPLYAGVVITSQRGLLSKAISVDGHSGWRVQWEVMVDRDDRIPGGVLDLIIVDTGNENSLSFFVTAATPDTAAMQDAEAMLETVRIA